MEKLLNKKEIAEALGVSVKAIDKWVCERRLPFIKLSYKCVRFIPSQVRAYLNRLRIKPAGTFALPGKRPVKRAAPVRGMPPVKRPGTPAAKRPGKATVRQAGRKRR